MIMKQEGRAYKPGINICSDDYSDVNSWVITDIVILASIFIIVSAGS